MLTEILQATHVTQLGAGRFKQEILCASVINVRAWHLSICMLHVARQTFGVTSTMPGLCHDSKSVGQLSSAWSSLGGLTVSQSEIHGSTQAAAYSFEKCLVS